MSMKNLKIGTRLGIGFAAMLVLMALSLGHRHAAAANVGNATEEMVEKTLVKERMVGEWFDLAGGQHRADFRDRQGRRQRHRGLLQARNSAPARR